MKLEMLKMNDIHPYARNPRKNDNAVGAVMESIRQCSYITPIVVDEKHVILAGHTRYKALVGLGIEEVQCLVCDGLTEEQKKKYRYLDNKTGEKAVWDLVKLENEMEGLDLEGFDFFGMEDQEANTNKREMVGATEIDMEEKVFREGQAKQRLDDLFLHFLNVAKKLQPKVIIAENVKGLIIGKAKGWVNQIVSAFGDAGYTVQIFLFNAAKMGVPQKRERVFFIAHRKDLNLPKLKMAFDLAPINFSEVREKNGKPIATDATTFKLLKYRTSADRDLSDINKRVRKKYSGFTSPINHDDEPASTVTSGGYQFRMSDGLLMTDRDFINVQTFPQDYDFMDQNVQYVCGMSVPPVMMANIASEVNKQWFEGL